jgi:Fe-S-cluster containining protein
MLQLPSENRALFHRAVERAATIDSIAPKLDAIYATLAREIDVQKPRCDQSGRCCRFEEYGHRLFVTTLELARFLAQLKPDQPKRQPWDELGCPYQTEGLCSVHTIRPFGCRIYFCDSASTVWQHEAYERLHRSIRDLHVELGVDYFYVEWRNALDVMGLLPTPSNVRLRVLR